MVQRGQGTTADDGYTQVINRFARSPTGASARQVADRAGNNGHPVTAAGEMPGQLMVTGSAGFIQRGKCLVDQQYVHIINILLEFATRNCKGSVNPSSARCLLISSAATRI
ncbi:MAG: hypothetical protein BWX85_00177 [Chloroflexi bacterium ADurb.Bin120]|jgi:hypothetical protein|nr:MAG: hypothetical protein BWX85_00177 [Chloroflexi bacterium ADurb.Bin120]